MSSGVPPRPPPLFYYMRGPDLLVGDNTMCRRNLSLKPFLVHNVWGPLLPYASYGLCAPWRGCAQSVSVCAVACFWELGGVTQKPGTEELKRLPWSGGIPWAHRTVQVDPL